MALGMTMQGARGETLAGMRSAVGLTTLDPAEIGRSYRGLIDLLRGLDRAQLLAMAEKARSLSRPRAAARVADEIERLAVKA